MATIREIKRRINSITNTQKITKAMEMVASVTFRKARTAILNARPYARKLSEIAMHLRMSMCEKLSTMLMARPVQTINVVAITSDKGLCGGFNSTVCRKALVYIREKEKENIKIILTVVGKKGIEFFKRRNCAIVDRYTDIFFKPNYTEVSAISKKMLDDYLSMKSDLVVLFYNELKGSASPHGINETLLPVQLDADQQPPVGYKTDYLFEPDPEQCLDVLLRRRFMYEMWRIILESHAAEQAARMAAMNGASKNAGDLITKLTLYYNKARQAAITKELLEVVAGAESLR
jgi:F-type H+-transporting ATPase subunit gamma